MDLSSSIIKFLILFFPGIISFTIVDKFTTHKKISQFYFVIYSFVFGTLSYLSVDFFMFLVSKTGLKFVEPSTFSIRFLENTGKPTNFVPSDIMYATFAGAMIGIIFCYLKNFDIIHRIFRFCKVTNQFSAPDVLRHFLNTKEAQGWITVRDLQNDLCYQGWLMAFSEAPDSSEHKEELLLRNVSVYKNSETEPKLFDCQYMYIPIVNGSSFVIEVSGEDKKVEEK